MLYRRLLHESPFKTGDYNKEKAYKKLYDSDAGAGLPKLSGV